MTCKIRYNTSSFAPYTILLFDSLAQYSFFSFVIPIFLLVVHISYLVVVPNMVYVNYERNWAYGKPDKSVKVSTDSLIRQQFRNIIIFYTITIIFSCSPSYAVWILFYSEPFYVNSTAAFDIFKTGINTRIL